MAKETVVVIGAYGSAGSAVAETLAERDDIDLVLIDDGEPGGGLCILRGCMPSKEVLSVGDHKFRAMQDPRISGKLEIDHEETIKRKDKHIHGFAEHRRNAIHGLAEQGNVEFMHGTASFKDNKVISVNDREIDADHVVIATGSKVNIPDIPGITNVPYQTSSDVLDKTQFPDTGIVLGFGTIGMELAPYLSTVGDMDITVVEHDDRPIEEACPEFGDAALSLYRDQFDIDIPTETYEKEVRTNSKDEIELDLEGKDGDTYTVSADELYLFTGRNPDIESLDLENTDIQPGRGWVRDTMESRDIEDVYIVGDVNAKSPILHVAKEQGYTAAENITREIDNEPKKEYHPTPHKVIFSALGVYPYAKVGYNEAETKEHGYNYVTTTRHAENDGVFKVKDAPHGLAKLIVDKDTHQVIGYQGLHLHADVMAKTMQVIIENNLRIEDIPDRAYHPTTPEIIDGLLRDAKTKLDI